MASSVEPREAFNTKVTTTTKSQTHGTAWCEKLGDVMLLTVPKPSETAFSRAPKTRTAGQL